MSSDIHNIQGKLPWSNRGDDAVQGHWVLARLGKRVLRPGGAELSRTLLANADVTDADVLELAPGLGRTATQILALRPIGADEPAGEAIAAQWISFIHIAVGMQRAALI